VRALVPAAAVAAVLLVSSVGLAAAETLPAPVQDVAHSALKKVGIYVPPGHERYNDPVDCPGGPYANHGAYVRAHKDDPAAGQSPCGKPVRSVTNRADSEAENAPDDADRDGEKTDEGPPPWARGQSHDGTPGKEPKEKQQHRADVESDEDAERDHDVDEDSGLEDVAPPAAPSSTTTVAPSEPTTTVAPPSSTTTTSLVP
jgi:hypothetical protein